MYSKLKMEVKESIKHALSNLKWKVNEEDIVLEEPPNPAMGDISCNIAFSLASKLKKSPMEIANQIKDEIKLPLYFTKVETKGPYINFYIDYTVFTTKVVNYIDSKYGELPEKNKQ